MTAELTAHGVALAAFAAQAQQGPDPEPWGSYLLSGLAVVLLYAATRVDTDSSGARRRVLTGGLVVLGAVAFVAALASGVDARL